MASLERGDGRFALENRRTYGIVDPSEEEGLLLLLLSDGVALHCPQGHTYSAPENEVPGMDSQSGISIDKVRLAAGVCVCVCIHEGDRPWIKEASEQVGLGDNWAWRVMFPLCTVYCLVCHGRERQGIKFGPTL